MCKQGPTGDEYSRTIFRARINQDFGSLPWLGPGLGEFSQAGIFSLNILPKSVDKFQ